MGLTVRDIMTPLEECVRDDVTLRQASQILTNLSLGSTPVVTRDGAVKGSLRNHHLVRAIAIGAQPDDALIAHLIQVGRENFVPHEIFVAADCSITETARTMAVNRVSHVLVKDGNRLVGVVAPEDMQSYGSASPDGLPFPPPELIRLVGGTGRRWLWRHFFRAGADIASSFREILAARGEDMTGFGSILDLGCGCGRIMRHWKDLRTPSLHGCDYNPALVEWCRRNLPFAEFTVNDVTPPLPFGDQSFEFVYAFSVFTHLDETHQKLWIEELRRIVKPNGVILVTVHGRSFLRDLDPAQQERFLSGELVVQNPDASGSNECATYHPEPYIRETLGRGFGFTEVIQAAETNLGQDVVLLRSP